MWSSNESSGEEKKFRLSLNMSGTCDRIAELELSFISENSCSASVLDNTRSLDHDGWYCEHGHSVNMDIVDVSIETSDSEEGAQVIDERDEFSDENLYLSSQPSSLPDLTQSDGTWSEDEDDVDEPDCDSGM